MAATTLRATNARTQDRERLGRRRLIARRSLEELEEILVFHDQSAPTRFGLSRSRPWFMWNFTAPTERHIALATSATDEPFDVVQRHRQSLLRRQRRQELDRVTRGRRLVHPLRVGREDREHTRPSALVTEVVAHAVHSDTTHPRDRILIAGDLLPPQVRTEERLLHRIGCDLGVAAGGGQGASK